MLVHLGLDGTHDAAALRYAAAVSRLGGTRRIEVVHSGPPTLLFTGLVSDPSAQTAAWLRQARAELARLVHGHFRGPPGCRVQLDVLGGAGFQGLLDRLRRGDTDLILAGKSEANAGFVEKLVRKAPCSVMVVPPGRSVAYRRILVTTDFSDHSTQAIEVAVAFARARKLRRLGCFHAYHVPYGYQRSGMDRESFQHEVETWARERYRDQTRTLDFTGLEATFVCEESPAVAAGILQQAERRQTDLLVMGARGKDALATALLGSTTAQVVRETPIPTLVVKPKGAGLALLDLLLGAGGDRERSPTP